MDEVDEALADFGLDYGSVNGDGCRGGFRGVWLGMGSCQHL